MKQFKVYKDIRKQAMILGLPLALFALLMSSVLLSLLVVIFSFSLITIGVVVLFNLGLYIILTHLKKGKIGQSFKRVFPKEISSKHINVMAYERAESDDV